MPCVKELLFVKSFIIRTYCVFVGRATLLEDCENLDILSDGDIPLIVNLRGPALIVSWSLTQDHCNAVCNSVNC